MALIHFNDTAWCQGRPIPAAVNICRQRRLIRCRLPVHTTPHRQSTATRGSSKDGRSRSGSYRTIRFSHRHQRCVFESAFAKTTAPSARRLPPGCRTRSPSIGPKVNCEQYCRSSFSLHRSGFERGARSDDRAGLSSRHLADVQDQRHVEYLLLRHNSVQYSG